MDWIEEMASAWAKDNPALDFSSLPPLIRLARLGSLIETFQIDVLAPFELTPGDYGVLSTLRRTGRPFALRPSQLYGRLDRSSGGMTKILKRLADLNLIERIPNPEDGRGSRVVLTPRGLTLHDRVFRAFAAASNRFLTNLSNDEKSKIDHSLKLLLEGIESPSSGSD